MAYTTRDLFEFARALTTTDVRLMSLLVLGGSLVIGDPAPALPRGGLHPMAPVLSLLGKSDTSTWTGLAATGTRTPRTELPAIDELVAAALAEAKLPGCVVTIGRHDRVLFQKAYGMRELEPDRVPMTEDTVFDLASLTKPIATATSLLILADRGRIGLDDPVSRYLPEFDQPDKKAITLRQLLIHVSGFPAETPLDDYKLGRPEALRRIAATPLKAAPGTRFIYSDIGFLVLEEVIDRITTQDLSAFATDAIFRPLGMTETGFLPSSILRERVAPTEQRDGGWIVGEVHDPRAFFLGGVAGHAGLFSTARDLVRYTQAILDGGILGGTRILSAESTRAMLAPHDVPGGIRALGWDVRSGFSANRGELFSRRAVGHGGYTGTALWLDPEEDLFVLFLSNRVHPDGKGSVNALAGRIATIAGERFGRAPETNGEPAAKNGAVELGIDVLASEHFARLQGARVGLITNASGRAGDGSRTVDLLRRAPGVTLVALFAPEHGLAADVERKIENATDEHSRLPVYSLYGDVFAPTEAMLAGIDTLVFDVQDAGARFFTYASTLHRTLRVAASRKLRIVVLDRPNPIDGVDVAGPTSTADAISFVNHHPVPVRHGMTLGELAEMINADEHLGAGLEVVRMRGWRRTAYFDQTGLKWISPSPNLRSVTEAVLYPGVALVEGTNVSVGRGTDTPFEVVGAPWMDDRFALKLASEMLPGVTFTHARFTPRKGAYAGQACEGVHLEVTDRTNFEPVRTGIAMARSLAELYPQAWRPDKLDQIIGNKVITEAILNRLSVAEIEALWQPDLDQFRTKRKKYLLYPEVQAGP